MVKCISLIFAPLFVLMCVTAGAEVGYRQTPWGSKTWTGPGRPAHWSPAPVQPEAKPVRPARPIDPGWGVRPPNRPGGAGGYWNGVNTRWCSPGYRCSTIVYSPVPRTEAIIIEPGKTAEPTTPAVRILSKQQCAGQTITRTDSQTGEMIIEYVSSSRDCP